MQLLSLLATSGLLALAASTSNPFFCPSSTIGGCCKTVALGAEGASTAEGLDCESSDTRAELTYVLNCMDNDESCKANNEDGLTLLQGPSTLSYRKSAGPGQYAVSLHAHKIFKCSA